MLEQRRRPQGISGISYYTISADGTLSPMTPTRIAAVVAPTLNPIATAGEYR